MCGRYVRRSDKQRIAEHFRVHGTVPDFGPSWNVAPTTFQPIVQLNRETGEREIVLMRWGLIPFWSKGAKGRFSNINAQAERVATAPAYRDAVKFRRCLVPSDAFYEWQRVDAQTKQPFAIALKSGELFAFAGLWESWRDPAADGPELLTFCVITTDPNEVVSPIHSRMPVILSEKDYHRWLAPGDADQPPIDLLRPCNADKMDAWRVDRRVGSATNDTPELLLPVIQAESNSTLFG